MNRRLELAGAPRFEDTFRIAPHQQRSMKMRGRWPGADIEVQKGQRLLFVGLTSLAVLRRD